MKNFDKALKKALQTRSDGKTEKDISPPIKVTFLSDKKEIAELELSNLEFIQLLAKATETSNFTGCRIVLDDGKKSYTFTLNVDQFILTKTEIGKPMK